MADNDRNSVYESRDHRWVDPDTIDMDINHPELGWIPYSAREDDEEALALFMDGKAVLGDYTGPPAPPSLDLQEIRSRTSMRKMDLLFKMHTDLGIISEEDAMAAVTSGVIPPVFNPIMEKYSPQQQLYVKMEFAGENRVARTWQALEVFARAIYGDRADAVLDGLFGIREMPDVKG